VLKAKLFQETFGFLKKSDVKIKIALSGDNNLIKQISSKSGIKMSKIDIDAKFFIIDRKEILFYLTPNKSGEDIAIWLNSEFFASAFASMFDMALR